MRAYTRTCHYLSVFSLSKFVCVRVCVFRILSPSTLIRCDKRLVIYLRKKKAHVLCWESPSLSLSLSLFLYDTHSQNALYVCLNTSTHIHTLFLSFSLSCIAHTLCLPLYLSLSITHTHTHTLFLFYSMFYALPRFCCMARSKLFVRERENGMWEKTFFNMKHIYSATFVNLLWTLQMDARLSCTVAKYWKFDVSLKRHGLLVYL